MPHEKEIRTARAAPLVASKPQTELAKLGDGKTMENEYAKTNKAKEKEAAAWQSETKCRGQVLELDGPVTLIGRATSPGEACTRQFNFYTS